jgi:DnaJ-class molecular chaperone
MSRACPTCGGMGGKYETHTAYKQEPYTVYDTRTEYSGYPPQPHTVTMPRTEWRTVPETSSRYVTCPTCHGSGRIY